MLMFKEKQIKKGLTAVAKEKLGADGFVSIQLIEILYFEEGDFIRLSGFFGVESITKESVLENKKFVITCPNNKSVKFLQGMFYEYIYQNY